MEAVAWKKAFFPSSLFLGVDILVDLWVLPHQSTLRQIWPLFLWWIKVSFLNRVLPLLPYCQVRPCIFGSLREADQVHLQYSEEVTWSSLGGPTSWIIMMERHWWRFHSHPCLHHVFLQIWVGFLPQLLLLFNLHQTVFWLKVLFKRVFSSFHLFVIPKPHRRYSLIYRFKASWQVSTDCLLSPGICVEGSPDDCWANMGISLSFKDAECHVPFHSKFKKVSGYPVGEENLCCPAYILFSLTVALWVFFRVIKLKILPFPWHIASFLFIEKRHVLTSKSHLLVRVLSHSGFQSSCLLLSRILSS